MKTTILIFIYFIFVSFTGKSADIPLWAWGHSFNGNISAMEYADNYIYTAGHFAGGAFILGNTNIINQGGTDVIIAKWDTLGNIIWATSIWGAGNDSAVNIKVNANNELVIVGSTNSPVLNIGPNTLNSNGGYDIYYAKYDLNGNALNAYIYGSANNEHAIDMCTDYSGNIYVASLNKLTQYSTSGIQGWQKNIVATQSNYIHQLAYSSFDSTIHLCGIFGGILTLDNLSVNVPFNGLWNYWPLSVYIAKIPVNGSTLWLKEYNNQSGHHANSAEMYINNTNGKIYVSHWQKGVGDHYFRFFELYSNGNYQTQSWGGLPHPAGWDPLMGVTPYSMSGKGDYVSIATDDYGEGFLIYQLSTHSLIKIYDLSHNNNTRDPHIFRGLNAIYTPGLSLNNNYKLGKIYGSLLTGSPSYQNTYKCLGTVATLNGNIIGGIGALTYSWAPATGLNNTNTNTVSFTVTNNITYTLTVTDQSGQIAKDTFNVISQSPIPAPNLTSQSPTICNDSIALYTNNGVPGNWFKIIQNGGWAFNNPYDYGLSTFAFTSGRYIYRAINTCGTIIDSIDLLPTSIVIANASSDTICAGQSVTLSSSGALNYSWTGGVTDNVPFSPAATQSYTVTGTDGNGCIDTESITIIVKPLPTINNTLAIPDAICTQGNSILSANSYCVPTIQQPPGTAAIVNFTFGSYDNYTGQTPGIYTHYNITPTVTAGYSYFVIIDKNATGISAERRTVWIDFNSDGDFDDAGEVAFNANSPSVFVSGYIAIPGTATNGLTRMRVGGIYSGANTPCYNSNYGEYEDYNLKITGGVNNNNITWLPNIFLPNNTGNSIHVTNINTTTTYTVSVTGINGCINTDSVTINVYPNTTSYTNTSICINQVPYVWNGLIIDSPGVYTTTLINANGCDSIATLNLNISLCGLCQPDFTVNWTPFTDSLVESQTWITTSGTVLIPLGAKVKYDANTGGYVSLNPGFKAEYGAVFVAQALNGCTPGAPQLPQVGKIMNIDAFSANEILLYPNPTTGMIHIQHDEKLKNIQIFDMVGKLVINQVCEGEPETHIDLSNWPNGVYHIKAVGYNSIKVVKNN